MTFQLDDRILTPIDWKPVKKNKEVMENARTNYAAV